MMRNAATAAFQLPHRGARVRPSTVAARASNTVTPIFPNYKAVRWPMVSGLPTDGGFAGRGTLVPETLTLG